jgi:glutathione S-transferase
MTLTLYAIHGSHPCVAVEKALALKGLRHRTIEWPPPLHVPMQRLLFGVGTVPALRLDGERIVGSRTIMRRLDALAPTPALYPADPAQRTRVEEADLWGDEVFQPVARELLWCGFAHAPAAMVSYAEHSRLPLPALAVRLSAPAIVAIQKRRNRTDDRVAAAAIRALPAQLDKVDAWIADRRMGDPAAPNAADLQILSTVRLLLTLDDLAPQLDARPAGAAARRLFPERDGRLPAGALPAAA